MTGNAQEARERPEPEEGAEPVPALVWLASVVLVIWGFAYFLLYSGDRSEIGGDSRTPVVVAAADAAGPDGATLYASRCAACHQPQGQGLAGAFPPLAGSPWPTGAEEVAARIVLHGLTGPIDVLGSSYNGAMPAFADQLSDAEIAAVLTHVRGHFGNTAGPVAPAQVAAVRASGRAAPWTAAELQ